MFLLMTKKLIARLFFPVPFLLLVLAAGLALVLWPKLGTRCRKAGNALLVTGVLLLLIGSLAGQLLLHTLTGVYPPLKPEELPEENYTIVVAGHGFHAESGVPPERWFDDEMQLRLHAHPSRENTMPPGGNVRRSTHFWDITASRRNASPSSRTR